MDNHDKIYYAIAVGVICMIILALSLSVLT